MLTERSPITDFIPQRDPFVAIDAILDASETGATTQFEVLERSIFVASGIFGEVGLIENVAQTAAAQAGWIFKSKGLDVPVGYIASIKNLAVLKLPRVGSILQTSIQVINNVMNITIVEGIVKSGDDILCKCEMRIFIDQAKS